MAKISDKKIKVLVCESDVRLLSRLKIWLKSMGVDAVTCYDGVIAQRIFKEEKPDILLISQKVNSIGSIELIENIQEMEPLQKIVVMLNEDIDVDTCKRYIDLHVEKYLNKPIDAETLFNNIDHMLKSLKSAENTPDKIDHTKEIDQARDILLTLFTNEFVTQLKSIINYSESIHSDMSKRGVSQEGTDLIDKVDKINIAGFSILDMVYNIMDTVKLKDKKLESKVSKILLNSSVVEILDKYSQRVENIEVLKDIDENYFIQSDILRFNQILDYLISNAIEYTKNKISIELKSSESNFSLIISDNGDGFKKNYSALKLFEGASSDGAQRGEKFSSMGIYIVKQLCSNLNYKLEISDSNELGGASIIISGKKDI